MQDSPPRAEGWTRRLLGYLETPFPSIVSEHRALHSIIRAWEGIDSLPFPRQKAHLPAAAYSEAVRGSEPFQGHSKKRRDTLTLGEIKSIKGGNKWWEEPELMMGETTANKKQSLQHWRVSQLSLTSTPSMRAA